MSSYNETRQRYLPHPIKLLLIAESPPPQAHIPSSRHFYRADAIRADDRLFTNTIWALYPETRDLPESTLEEHKDQWLRRFQADGRYMVEALPHSLPHHVTKPERQVLIKDNLPHLIKQLRELTNPQTKIILIKSNVFEVAAPPLRQAGFAILNTELVDYPGQYNQRAYREKLARLASTE